MRQQMMTTQKNHKLNRYYLWCKQLFKDLYGNPFELTPGQCEVFHIVFSANVKRGVIKTTTQYGKSEVTSMGIITAMIKRKEKILIVSPSTKQSEIIMGNVIKHLFDHPYLESMVDYAGKKEQLKQERSRKRIVMKNGSEVMILTAEATNLAKEAKSLMGFGASMVIVDESSLIPDQIFGKILRMVGGYEEGKLVQLGNPFEQNHFARAFEQDRYVKLSIDYKQAIKEGRLTEEFIKEARENLTELEWTVFYECKFPQGGGDNSLIPHDWIQLAVNNGAVRVFDDDKRQGGLDVARFGRDKTVLIVRKGKKTEKLHQTSDMDTMAVAGWSSKIFDDDELDELSVDIIGLGSGVYDRLDELGYDVIGVNVGSSPTDDEAKEKFYNLRAEVFWNLRTLFKPNREGKSEISIPDDKELIQELQAITYKFSSEKKIRIESKDEIKKKIGRSPDKADALSLAFFDLTDADAQLMIV